MRRPSTGCASPLSDAGLPLPIALLGLAHFAHRFLAHRARDAVEDQDVTNAEIIDLFGPTVASLVAEVTDDKTLPKQVRKHEQIAAAPYKSDGASVIKLADKTSNLLAIANSPPPWPNDRKQAYVEWARAVVSGLPLKPAGLLGRFEEAARLAMDSIQQQG